MKHNVINGMISEGDACATDRVKIIVLGAARVGKTSLINRFLYDTFPKKYIPTVEEFHQAEFTVADTIINVDVLDTSGSLTFPAMRKLAISTADAFVIMYSVTDENSFEEMIRIREEIRRDATQEANRVVAVVAGKCDLSGERWSTQKIVAETLVTIDWEDLYFEVSPKLNIKVLEVFRGLLKRSRVSMEIPMKQLQLNRRRKSFPYQGTAPSVDRDRIHPKRHSCSIS